MYEIEIVLFKYVIVFILTTIDSLFLSLSLLLFSWCLRRTNEYFVC